MEETNVSPRKSPRKIKSPSKVKKVLFDYNEDGSVNFHTKRDLFAFVEKRIKKRESSSKKHRDLLLAQKRGLTNKGLPTSPSQPLNGQDDDFENEEGEEEEEMEENDGTKKPAHEVSEEEGEYDSEYEKSFMGLPPHSPHLEVDPTQVELLQELPSGALKTLLLADQASKQQKCDLAPPLYQAAANIINESFKDGKYAEELKKLTPKYPRVFNLPAQTAPELDKYLWSPQENTRPPVNPVLKAQDSTLLHIQQGIASAITCMSYMFQVALKKGESDGDVNACATPLNDGMKILGLVHAGLSIHRRKLLLSVIEGPYKGAFMDHEKFAGMPQLFGGQLKEIGENVDAVAKVTGKTFKSQNTPSKNGQNRSYLDQRTPQKGNNIQGNNNHHNNYNNNNRRSQSQPNRRNDYDNRRDNYNYNNNNRGRQDNRGNQNNQRSHSNSRNGGNNNSNRGRANNNNSNNRR